MTLEFREKMRWLDRQIELIHVITRVDITKDVQGRGSSAYFD